MQLDLRLHGPIRLGRKGSETFLRDDDKVHPRNLQRSAATANQMLYRHERCFAGPDHRDVGILLLLGVMF